MTVPGNDASESADTSTISGRGASGVGLAAVVAGVSTYLVLIIVTKYALDAVDSATFLVFWSLLFLLFGAVTGVYQETTRAVRAAGLGVGPAQPGAASVMRGGLIIGGLCATAVLVTTWLWSSRLFGDDGPRLTAVLCVALVLFAGHSALAGALSGEGEWGWYAALVSGEAILRFAVVAAAFLAGAGTFGLEAAVVAGSLAWLVLLAVSPRARHAARARADVGVRALLNNSGHAMVAAASSAALVVGFPVILRATTSAQEWAISAPGPLVLAISLTRAPLMIPLAAYQGVAVTYFLSRRREGLAPALRLAGVIGAVGLVGAAAAALVGPWLMVVLIKPEFEVAGSTLAGLTIGATVLALLTLSGSAVLALGHHRAYSLGWVVAAAAALVVLLVPLPLSLEGRAVLSLIVGPIVGLVVHGWVLARG